MLAVSARELDKAGRGAVVDDAVCCPRMQTRTYTAILEREGDIYVALCPDVDVASQGRTVEEALANLKEAVELFLECADRAEVERRLHTEVFVTRFEAAHG